MQHESERAGPVASEFKSKLNFSMRTIVRRKKSLAPDEMQFWHVRCFLILGAGKLKRPASYYSNKDRMMKPKRTNKQTVTGTIIPQGWDSKGKLTGVSIQAIDKSEYIVKSYKRGKELFDFINEKVKVTGKLQERLDGKVLIEVNQFEVLKSANTTIDTIL